MAKREVSSDTARPLANARREKFAQLIADGVKPSEAYKKAYKCSSVVAMASVSRMLGYADVKGRIEYLQSQIADNKAERRRKKLAVCESIWSGEVAEVLQVEEQKTYTVVGFYERPGFENYSAPGYTALTTFGGTLTDNGKQITPSQYYELTKGAHVFEASFLTYKDSVTVTAWDEADMTLTGITVDTSGIGKTFVVQEYVNLTKARVIGLYESKDGTEVALGKEITGWTIKKKDGSEIENPAAYQLENALEN